METPGAPPAIPEPRTARSTSTYATASLIFGILGLTVLPVVGPALAIVFAINGKRDISLGKSTEGKGLADAGLILGIVGLILSLLLLYFISTRIWAPPERLNPLRSSMP